MEPTGNTTDDDGRSPIWRGKQPQGENRDCNRPYRLYHCARCNWSGPARRMTTNDRLSLSAQRARRGIVHTSARLVVTMKVRRNKGIITMDYGAWFLFTLRMEAKSQRGGLYLLMRSVPPSATKKIEVKHPCVTQNSLPTVASFRTWRG
jgi:hypothetical protein